MALGNPAPAEPAEAPGAEGWPALRASLIENAEAVDRVRLTFRVAIFRQDRRDGELLGRHDAREIDVLYQRDGACHLTQTLLYPEAEVVDDTARYAHRDHYEYRDGSRAQYFGPLTAGHANYSVEIVDLSGATANPPELYLFGRIQDRELRFLEDRHAAGRLSIEERDDGNRVLRGASDRRQLELVVSPFLDGCILEKRESNVLPDGRVGETVEECSELASVGGGTWPLFVRRVDTEIAADGKPSTVHRRDYVLVEIRAGEDAGPATPLRIGAGSSISDRRRMFSHEGELVNYSHLARGTATLDEAAVDGRAATRLRAAGIPEVTPTDSGHAASMAFLAAGIGMACLAALFRGNPRART
jgi:hypothetical protein